MRKRRFLKALIFLSGFVVAFGTFCSIDAVNNPEALVGNYYQLPHMVLGSKNLEELWQYDLNNYSKEEQLSHSALGLAFDSPARYFPSQSCFLDSVSSNPIVYKDSGNNLVVKVVACAKIGTNSPMFKVVCLNGKFKNSTWWIGANCFGPSHSSNSAIEVSPPDELYLVAHN